MNRCPLLAGFLLSCVVFAQVTPKFETVDVHASGPNTIPRMRIRFSRGVYELGNASVAEMIGTAWGVDADKVAGGPDWLDEERFDVIGTAPAGSTPEALQTMLRAMLEDRFHLVAHKDTRQRSAYALTVGKKLRLKEAASEESGCKVQPGGRPVMFECRNMTMAAFANELPHMAGASGYLFNYGVVDRTKLKGAWNFSVKWSLRGPGQTISLFDALESQLGLKLALAKVPTPVVVVDSVVKPAGNPSVTEKPARPLEFEVASIKPAAGFIGSNVGIQPGGHVRVGMSLKGLIQEAWGDLSPDRIFGGPKSMDGTYWIVEAKAPAQEDSLPGWNGPVWNGVDLHSMRMMLRALLIDRFKLEAHTENRQVSGYALVAAKPKLRKADPANRPGCKDGPGADGKDPRLANPMASSLVTCRNMTLAQFAEALSAWNPEQTILYGFPPVVDSTGIDGRYDMTINFTPPRQLQNIGGPSGTDAGTSDPDGTISIFDALEKQLGLKLESHKVTAQVLVIDRVNESPTEN